MVNMAFNLGATRLEKFRQMRFHLSQHNWKQAAAEWPRLQMVPPELQIVLLLSRKINDPTRKCDLTLIIS